jgi:hypothetical protein
MAAATLCCFLALAASRAPDPGFPVRMVKLSGVASDHATIEHVRFCKKLGFNALWVYGWEAGEWTKDKAPGGPFIDPSFLRLARWCRRHKMDIWVSINPVADSHNSFVFSDPDGEGRALQFARLLRDTCGVTRIVLSFDDTPTELKDLGDVFRYGLSSAPAHLDLARRIAWRLPKDTSFWLCGAAYCDAQLGDGTGPYSKAFLAGLPELPREIGIVWTGPTVLSPTITREGLLASRARLGGRKLLLYDNFPINENFEDDALALILGALRGREAGIRDVVSAYLACPAQPLASSRLSLMTIAEFLRDPEAYDPHAAVARAIAKLAGRDAEALDALTTQQLEWGGFIGELNYWPRDEMNPEAVARRLNDPAFVESFTWTVARYPDRMAALSGLADTAFRDDLLTTMRRRLAIARAVPLAVDYVGRVRAGSPGADEVRRRIGQERELWKDHPDTAHELDRFLAAVGLRPSETTP